MLTSKAKAREYVEYLRYLADDFSDSGSEATADDYRNSATMIEELLDLVDDEHFESSGTEEDECAEYEAIGI